MIRIAIRLPLLILLIIVCLIYRVPTTTYANALITDVSDHLIKIDTSFTGTNVLLFGARNENGIIVVVVRGPKHTYNIRKKERVAGIWVNRDYATFNDVESFHAIASSKPLKAVKNEYLLNKIGIGMDRLPFALEQSSEIIQIEEFKQALLDEKNLKQLYSKKPGRIPFIAETLFRVVIHFPETIPDGTYTAETYLINNGQLSGVQITPILVKKTGFDAFMYNLAHEHAFFYGILAIAIALASGWTASTLFRKL